MESDEHSSESTISTISSLVIGVSIALIAVFIIGVIFLLLRNPE
jgi:hypothetical protein